LCDTRIDPCTDVWTTRRACCVRRASHWAGVDGMDQRGEFRSI